MSRVEHWEKVYTERAADQVGWYTPHLETSLQWISDLELDPADPIIDVGGGASTLVDDMLSLGRPNLTVLDISSRALAQAQRRLGGRAADVRWLQGDVTEIEMPDEYYGLWHDRAVFHFLVEDEPRMRYRQQLLSALKAGGFLVMGCFAPEAPDKCSGLPVQRYTPEGLDEFFGGAFTLLRQHNEMHVTPGGVEQAYVYCLFEKIA